MLKIFVSIVAFVLVSSTTLHAQTLLRVSKQRFGSVRSYEVFTGEKLSYKLKGDMLYRKNRIIAMQDSSIVFDNDQEIKLSQIKSLLLKKNIHLVGTVQGFFLGGAVAFIGLNTVNNIITETSPVFSEKAAYISAGLLAASFLIRELGIKRIRTNKYSDLKILTLDFQHLNADSTSTSK